MKKILYTLLLSIIFLSACSKDDEETPFEATINFNSPELTFNSDGYWSKYNENTNLNLYGFCFRHYLTEYDTVEGFIVSKNQDTGIYNPMYLHPYTVVGGEGVNGAGSPYLVATWATTEDPANPSLSITQTNLEPFSPLSIKVNNTTYAYYTMRDGNDYSKKFEKGDWFKLTIHGVNRNGEEKTVDFMLANCTSETDPASGIVTKWTSVDLSSLGEVNYIYFTLSSSDNSQWGMNTPGYFAIGSFSYKLGI